MRLLSILFLAGLFLVAGTTYAQELTKEEEKEWKNKAKQYKKNPDALKALTESRELYREEADRFEAQVNELQARMDEYESRITELEQENMQLTNTLMTAQQTIQQLTDEKEELTARRPQTNMAEDMTGTVFRVQIGAFKKTRVPDDLADSENMQLEDSDGMQKVMVGKFATFEEAKQLMDYLQRMGVKGAWIVPYVDGRRVPLKEVLKAGEAQQ